MTSFFAEALSAQYLGWIFDGFVTTLELVVLVIPCATALGFLIALARSSSNTALSVTVTSMVSAFRNSPLLVQLFFWYFGVPAILPESVRDWINASHSIMIASTVEISWPSYEFCAAGLGLILYSAAYISEEIRSGILSVARTQRQAAEALGMRPTQVFRYIVLPQALRISLPTLMGQYMNIVKNSSLAMAIGVAELSYAARQVETVSFKTFQAFGITTMLYIAIIACIEVMAKWLRIRYPVSQGRR